MNLQDTIIQEATQLFRKQGFTATTMRQISKAADCTNAALYYYYPDGKKHILQAVIQQRSKQLYQSLQFPDADNLESLLTQIHQRLDELMPHTGSYLNWLMVEFDTLPDEDRRLIQDQIIKVQQELQAQIARFVTDPLEAQQLAWLIYCMTFGYRQLFFKLAIGEREELPIALLGEFVTTMITKTRE